MYDSDDDDFRTVDENTSDYVVEIWEDNYYGADKDYIKCVLK